MALVDGINHLLVQVTDLDRSEAFYRDVFGFDVVGRGLVAEEGPNCLLRAAGGHMILLVEVEQVTPFRPNSMSTHHAFYLREEQFNRVKERRRANGFDVGDTRAEFRAKGQLSFDVFDPDGHRYQVQSVGKASSEQLMANAGNVVCGKVEDFAIGSVAHFEKQQFYLVRQEPGFLALSHWCPHMNGMVQWREDYWSFYCPFHAATFNRLGECTAHQKYPIMRTHPVTVTDDGDVLVNTSEVVKRPQGFRPDQFTPRARVRFMAEVESLNHTAMCVHDLVEALNFYCHVLGGKRASRVNFQIEEVLSGVAVFQSVILEDYLFALCVAPNEMPMPEAGKLRGAHGFRHGFVVARSRFDEMRESLQRNGIPFEGPVDHPEAGPFGQSIYFKDPSGNFLETLWRRDEATLNLGKRRYVTTE